MESGIKYWPTWAAISFLIMTAFSTEIQPSKLRYMMYLTGQHTIIPEASLVDHVTHVALAFMRSDILNDMNRTEWPLFTTIEEVRAKFVKGTIIQIAIGGWGDTTGFEKAAKSEQSRTLFAENVRAMLDATGADGADIDWEYPGGNGEDYKTHPNSNKTWEISAYPKLLAAIRATVGPSKTISAAVPGIPRDMLAFTHSTVPKIMESLDFLNIMTYDLMNRRDNITKHHTGTKLSIKAVDAYMHRGLTPEKANLGLAFYVKWFKTAPGVNCHERPVGCKTELMEDPETGADLGQAGAFSWHDQVPDELSRSFAKALAHGVYDKRGGGHYFWDETERLFWSWDTPHAIKRKLDVGGALEEKKLGGVFAWGLGEDAPKFDHLRAANAAIEALSASRLYKGRSEL